MFSDNCIVYYHYIATPCTTNADCASNEVCKDHDNDPGTPPVCGKINLCCY